MIRKYFLYVSLSLILGAQSICFSADKEDNGLPASPPGFTNCPKTNSSRQQQNSKTILPPPEAGHFLQSRKIR